MADARQLLFSTWHTSSFVWICCTSLFEAGMARRSAASTVRAIMALGDCSTASAGLATVKGNEHSAHAAICNAAAAEAARRWRSCSPAVTTSACAARLSWSRLSVLTAG